MSTRPLKSPDNSPRGFLFLTLNKIPFSRLYSHMQFSRNTLLRVAHRFLGQQLLWGVSSSAVPVWGGGRSVSASQTLGWHQTHKPRASTSQGGRGPQPRLANKLHSTHGAPPAVRLEAAPKCAETEVRATGWQAVSVQMRTQPASVARGHGRTTQVICRSRISLNLQCQPDVVQQHFSS